MAELVHIDGLGQILKTLESLPAEYVKKGGSAIRLSLRSSAQVVQAESQLNVDRLAAEGETNEATGTLRKAIIVSRKKPGNFKGERYWLRIKRGSKSESGQPATTYGAVLEFGDERIPAKAWMRRAWEAKKGEALDKFMSEAERRINAITKQIERKARK